LITVLLPAPERPTIAEDDVVEADLVLERRQVFRIRLVVAADRLVHEVVDVLRRAGALDHHRNELREVANVVGELPEQRLERHERAELDRVVPDEIGAKRQHDQVQREHRDRHGPLDEAVDPEHAVHGGADVGVPLAIPALGLAAQPEGLDDAHGGHDLLRHAQRLRLVLLDGVAGVDGLGRKDARADDRDGNEQQRYRRQLPVEEEHHREAGDQLAERQHAPLHAVIDRLLHLRDVAGEALQDHARLVLVVVVDRQVLGMVEEPIADVADER
jgi:hypothetical protein